jgi:protein-disulfide isomerase
MPPYQQAPEYNQPPIPKHNPWIIPVAIVLSGALVGSGIYMSKKNDTDAVGNTQTAKTVIGDINISPVGPSDHILGNPNAPVKIVEYTDTECPFCEAFHETMQLVMGDYGKRGEVAWVVRHFPIDQLHKRAHKEAIATECANTLGGPSKFWEYLDTIFSRTQSNDTLDIAKLPRCCPCWCYWHSTFNPHYK